MMAMWSGSRLYLRGVRPQPADRGLDVVQLARELHLRAGADRDARDGVARRIELRRRARRAPLLPVSAIQADPPVQITTGSGPVAPAGM